MSFDDQVDSATELFLNAALSKRHNVLTHCQVCYNCGEAITEGAYCDEFCQKDHEKRERLANGLIRHS